MRKRKSSFAVGSDAYSISRALQAAREREETTVRTPEERAKMAKFGATLVGVRSPAFDEAVAQRQESEEKALQDVTPFEIMEPEIPQAAAQPAEVPPQQK